MRATAGKLRVIRKMKSEVNCFEMWWPGTELNRRRQPFQGCALPPELPGHVSKPARRTQATRIVRFTLIVAGVPTEKQLNAERVRNVVDYSKRPARSTSIAGVTPRHQTPALRARHDCDPGWGRVCRCDSAYCCPPAEELCSPSHDASCGSCCDFRSTQLLMRSIDCR